MIARCSSLPRVFQCPDCLEACEGLGSTSSPASKSGDKVHDQLNGHTADRKDLSSRETWVAEAFKSKRDEIIAKLVADHGEIITPYPEMFEQYFETDVGEHKITGSIDYYCQFDDGFVFLCDYKSGYKEQIKAFENRQVQGYALHLFRNLKVKPHAILAYIFSAGDEGDAMFEPSLYGAHHEIEISRSIIEQLNKNGRATGEQCEYCPAAGSYDRCPESCADVSELVKKSDMNLAAIVDPMKLADMLNKCKFVVKLEKQLKARVEALWAEDELSMCSVFEEQEGSNKASVTNAQRAFQVLIGDGLVSNESFMGCVDIKTGEKGLLGVAKNELLSRGIKVGQHKRYIYDLLEGAGCLEYKKNKTSIVVKKKDA